MPNDVAVAMYRFAEFQRDLAYTREYQDLLRVSDGDAMRAFCMNAFPRLGYTTVTRNGEPTVMRYPVGERFNDSRFDKIRDVLRVEFRKLSDSKAIINMHYHRASRGVLSRAIADIRNQKAVTDRIPQSPMQIRLQNAHQRKQSDIRKAVGWVASASGTFSDYGFDGDFLGHFERPVVPKYFSDRFYKGAYERRVAQAEVQRERADEIECATRKLASLIKMEQAFAHAMQKDLFVTSTSDFIKSQAGNTGSGTRWGGNDRVLGEFYGGIAIGGYLHRHTLALAYNLRQQAMTDPSRWYDVAAFMMVGIIRAHPYTDGNGRTARSLYAITLIKNNMPFIAPARNWQQNQIHNTNIDAPAQNVPPTTPVVQGADDVE